MDKHDFTKVLGARIKNRRAELGITIRDLAAKTDLSASYIGDIENQRTTPNSSKLVAIASALAMPIEELLDSDETIKKDSDIYLKNHIFPNGLTYNQMNEKIKQLEKIQGIMNNNKGR